MSKLMRLPVSNNSTLKQIEAKSALLSPKVPQIREAYLKYHACDGKPKTLAPLGISDEESDALYKVYKGETEKYAVKWIGDYRAAPEQTHCPLCGGPNPSQLEHFLPRAHFPEFTVLSWNLVPTCAVCNPKRGHHAHSPGEALPLVHPYYEAALLVQPLVTATIVRPFEAVSFKPQANSDMPPEIIQRIERQIRLCFDADSFNRWLSKKLWKETHAELSGMSTQQEAEARVGRSLRINRGSSGLNSWDTIFFRALVADAEAIAWMRETPSPIPL